MVQRGALGALCLVGAVAFGGGAPAPPHPQDMAPDELPTHLIKVLRTTNKAQTNRYVPRVYTINNVNPFDLFRWIRRTAQIEEGAFYFFAKPEKSEKEGEGPVARSGKIVVVVPEYMVPGVDLMMQTIDRAGLTSSAGEEYYYFRPKHRHVEDTGFTDVINALRGTTGDTHADKEANMFLVYAAPSKCEDVKRFLPQFDQRPPQVMIEVAVYEVYVDNESKLGLDYVAWKNGPGRNLFAVGAFAERERIYDQRSGNPLFNSGTGGTYGLPGHGFRARGNNSAYFLDVPSAFFDYLAVKGKARVMTAAKLATRNLVPAVLTCGDTILYYETRLGSSSPPRPAGQAVGYETNVGGSPNAGLRPPGLPLDPEGLSSTYPDNRTVVGTQVSRVLTAGSTGLKLEIDPIIAENRIHLLIKVLLVSHTGFDDKGVPQLVQRSVTSEVEARDGQELILGGYGREVFVQRADKIPFLGSLPLIGYLFGGDANTVVRRQVVLVVTPHRIGDDWAMDYAGTRIDAKAIRSKALREAPSGVPDTPFGFDQWLMDPEEK